MAFRFNLKETIQRPDVYLCDVDKTILGALHVTQPVLTKKFNDIDEFTFTLPRTYTDIYGRTMDSPLYDMVEAIRIIYVDQIGYFEIQEPSIRKDTVTEYKECTAYSLQYDLTKKYLKSFIINQYTDESIDDVLFYSSTKQKSLLDLCLEKLPQWSIGHVDGKLVNKKRFFEVDDQDVYSFLTQDVAETFGCVFVFDTIHNTIHAYAEDNIGEDTSIYVSYDNLANEITTDYQADDIITSLTVLGADDLDVRSLNMGQDSILDLSYYHTPEWMGQELCDAWTAYQEKFQAAVPEYTKLSDQVEEKFNVYYELHNRVPDDKTSEKWELYGLNYLKIKQKAAEDTTSFKRELGWSDKKNANYSKYKEDMDKLNAIKKELNKRQGEIKNVETEINNLQSQMKTIADKVHWKNNLTTDQLKKISRFIHEDTWRDDNFLITDKDTPEEVLATRKALLENGQRYLAKLSRPQLKFTMSMRNIFAIPEFRQLANRFEVGNYIHVTLREGYSFHVRILEYTLPFEEPDSFDCVFGNVLHSKDEFDNHTDLINQAVTAGKTVADWKSYWQKSSETVNDIDLMIKQGLDTAITSIKSSSNLNDITIDEHGIHLRMKNEDGSYSNQEAIITGNKILYSNDNLMTAKTGLGEFEIEGQTFYGVLADAVLAGYVGASHLVGNEITNGNNFYVNKNGDVTARNIQILGGSLKIGKDPVKAEITAAGKLIAMGAEIHGKIVSQDIHVTGGTIGGWTITEKRLKNEGVFLNAKGNGYAFAAGGANEDGSDATTWIKHEGKLYSGNAEFNGGSQDAASCRIYNYNKSYVTEMYGKGFHIYGVNDPGYGIAVNEDSIVSRKDNRYTQMQSSYFLVYAAGEDSKETYTKLVLGGVENSSLAELKSNIKKEENLLEDVLNTDIYSFNYKADLDRGTDHKLYGFVIGDKYATTSKILSEDKRGINSYSSVGVLWGAVKELAEKVEQLEKRIEELENANKNQGGETVGRNHQS